jgi:hypothetical protein
VRKCGSEKRRRSNRKAGMKRDLPIAQLVPGDVLLYRGRGLVSDAIRLIDCSEVSHAGLFLGRFGDRGRSVGEAVREGLLRRELQRSIEHADWVESRRLKEMPATLEPVLGRAAHYLDRGERYAFEQILLLAFLCITRNLAGSSALGRLLRVTLDAAADFLLQLVHTGREPMLCSEFVYRCYGEGLPGSLDVLARVAKAREALIGTMRGIRRGSALALYVERQGEEAAQGIIDLSRSLRIPRPPDLAGVDEAIRDYFSDLRTGAPRAARVDLASPELNPSFERFSAALGMARGRTGKEAPSRSESMTALFDAAADFVTPGDLQRSRSLAFIGKLDRKRREP